MHDSQWRRRDLGRLVGAAGISALAGGAFGGVSSPRPARSVPPVFQATGLSVAALRSFDDTMESFMKARQISGGQLAVTYQGRLVLARGYSYGTAGALTVRPTSLFRVASVSKPITAAALALAAGDLLDSPVTSTTSVLSVNPPLGQTRDPRMFQVTLKDLLLHTGGWDRDISGDPMFKDHEIARAFGASLPITNNQIIKYMVGRPLDFNPGSRYAYSNYGYMLAGRAIEDLSGMSYQSYVQRNLFDPLGITRMRLADTLTPRADEVPYRSQYTGVTVMDNSGATVPQPYGYFNINNMAAHGGWLASAVDLVRFATLFDSANGVLSQANLDRIFAIPRLGTSDGVYYGLGWQVRLVNGGAAGRNTWHNGSLPGTHSLLVRTYHGMSWAVLFNRRDDASGLSYDAIDPALWNAAGAVTSWPSHDLFPAHF
ncbi:serine hydrolase [Micromonospora sp. KC721]|uniref:serine hydrolase domain-containing protein n=1 Tax=Micromonospora sp. KC721 TaxID=2530380 RepID=UPI00104ECB04|nr:serine hydrolase domain-containing protein [Micromonospora sp. KC721]TDB81073.1 class A beta-lactamase-related serine hydrolase [Micromonospora sp. KC721]